MILPDIVRDAICGGSGAVLGTVVGMPFDTIKVRLQTSGVETFKSPWHCVRETVRHEGGLALWKGSLPALASALTENLVVFAANGVIRRSITAFQGRAGGGSSGINGDAAGPDVEADAYLGFWQEAAVGGASGFCSATAICPAEVVKVRMQCDRRVTSSTTSATTAAARSRFVESGLRLWRKEGVRGFFRGLPALWARDVPFYIVFFSAYTTYIDAACTFHGCAEKRDLPMFQFAMGGGVAGVFGWGAVFPLDVVKSRVQLGAMGKDMSLVRATRAIVREEGARSILRGYLPAVLRGFPANGALLLGVEMMKKFLHRIEEEEEEEEV